MTQKIKLGSHEVIEKMQEEGKVTTLSAMYRIDQSKSVMEAMLSVNKKSQRKQRGSRAYIAKIESETVER